MKKEVKLQLDKKHFTRIEVEESKLPIVQEHNREVWRAAKREVRHESLYSLEAMSEQEPALAVCASAEEDYIEREEREERSAKLHRAIAQLTERQREMVTMVYFENRTQDEVAAHFGITKQAVSNAMSRIYAALRKNLEKT